MRRLEAGTTSRGGILLPDKSREKPSQGEVLAVGEGTLLESGELRPLALKPGERILFSRYAATELKLDGETLLVMRESDVLAVIETAGNEEKAA